MKGDARPALSLVSDVRDAAICAECGRLKAAHDAMHRKYMGLRSQIQTTRDKVRQLDIDLVQSGAELAAARAMLIAYRNAFAVIAGAQESKRTDAGIESSDEILRLAAGKSPDDFSSWQAAIETMISGQIRGAANER